MNDKPQTLPSGWNDVPTSGQVLVLRVLGICQPRSAKMLETLCGPSLDACAARGWVRIKKRKVWRTRSGLIALRGLKACTPQ
jgi:hypothetical protein